MVPFHPELEYSARWLLYPPSIPRWRWPPDRHSWGGNLRNSSVRGQQTVSAMTERPGTRGTAGEIHWGGGSATAALGDLG